MTKAEAKTAMVAYESVLIYWLVRRGELGVKVERIDGEEHLPGEASARIPEHNLMNNSFLL